MTILAGKKLLITGVVNTDSIAFAAARAAQALGADIVLTTFEREQERTAEAVRHLDRTVDVLELDVTEEAHFERLSRQLRERWGHLDGALHAVAFAPRNALAGEFLDGDLESVQRAFATSTYSYAALARLLAGLAPASGGSLVGLDFDAGGAWPVYNWMGVCKSALQSASRYIARDLGPRRIRSNLIAAGPLHTRAAGGIPDFDLLTAAWETRSPIEWDPRDPSPVADAVCFLLSDMGRGISGEIIHVDGGYHAMAADLRPVADAG
jgi:meromycolic acid enoyl-[acyl-carrier-protein] reductase